MRATWMNFMKTLLASISFLFAMQLNVSIPTISADSTPPTAPTIVSPTRPTNFPAFANKTSRTLPVPDLYFGMHGTDATWMNQVLSLLGWLPVQFQPDLSASAAAKVLADELQAENFQPILGKWSWQGAYPDTFKALWSNDAINTITVGAVDHVESTHHLTVDGIIGPEVRGELLNELNTLAAGFFRVPTYMAVGVTKMSPEMLRVIQNGSVILSIPCNTGVAASPAERSENLRAPQHRNARQCDLSRL